MKNAWIMLAAASMMAGAALAADEVTPNLDKGTMSLEGAGYYDGTNPQGGEGQLQLAFGYFIMDNLELAGLAGFKNNDVYTEYDVGARAEYNFDLGSAFVPFVGASIVWAGADADENEDANVDTAVGSLQAGVKWFIRDNVALSFSAVYEKAADEIYVDEDNEIQDDNFGGLFGVRFYFD